MSIVLPLLAYLLVTINVDNINQKNGKTTATGTELTTVKPIIKAPKTINNVSVNLTKTNKFDSRLSTPISISKSYRLTSFH